MHIRIRHRTSYRYTAPIEYAIQLLRLTPSEHAGQRVRRWNVYEVGRAGLPVCDDGYGNVVHLLTLNRAHQEAVVVAEGEVETIDTHGILRGAVERFPTGYYLRSTPATRPDERLVSLAEQVRSIRDPVDRLHRLMAATLASVRYDVGTTTVDTTAADALARGSGVCQDHAHILVACSRVLGHPARYVSGYMWSGETEGPHEAGHAWAEVHLDDLGWVGFDPANGLSPTEAYVRVAIGLDYRETAPVTGIWRGQAEESLAVAVQVQQLQTPQ
jgi:transglutaminase-like putative cysteine protease